MKKIVVLISGSGSNLEAIVNNCNSNDINGEVIKVISNDPSAYGLKRASALGIPTKIIDHKKYKNRDDFENSLEKYLDQLNPDLIVLAGFMRILGSKITNKYLKKMINLHPSLLPKYPGLNTHEKALSNSDKIHGVSIHFVSSELDAGPLIAQGIIDLKKNDKLDEVINRIHTIEHQLLPKIISEICKGNIYLNKSNEINYLNINLKNQKILKIKYEL